MGLLDDVRAGAAASSASARHVTIQSQAIAPYAATLPLEAARAPELDPGTHYLGEPEATLAYVVQLDAINFGSGYFPHLLKRPGLSGYFTVASGLKDWFALRGPLTAGQLQELSAEDCSRMFGQEPIGENE